MKRAWASVLAVVRRQGRRGIVLAAARQAQVGGKAGRVLLGGGSVPRKGVTTHAVPPRARGGVAGASRHGGIAAPLLRGLSGATSGGDQQHEDDSRHGSLRAGWKNMQRQEMRRITGQTTAPMPDVSARRARRSTTVPASLS